MFSGQINASSPGFANDIRCNAAINSPKTADLEQSMATITRRRQHSARLASQGVSYDHSIHRPLPDAVRRNDARVTVTNRQANRPAIFALFLILSSNHATPARAAPAMEIAMSTFAVFGMTADVAPAEARNITKTTKSSGMAGLA